MSSDYASMANAAIALYEATADAAYLAEAVSHLDALDRWYIDEANAGHYLTAADSRDVPLRIRGDIDEAIPSATSQIIEAFARVATATGQVDLLDRAWAVAKAATGRIRDQAYGQAGIVNACTILEGSRKLVLVEDMSTPAIIAGRIRSPRSAPRRPHLAAWRAADRAAGQCPCRHRQDGGLALPRPILPAADQRPGRVGKSACGQSIR